MQRLPRNTELMPARNLNWTMNNILNEEGSPVIEGELCTVLPQYVTFISLRVPRNLLSFGIYRKCYLSKNKLSASCGSCGLTSWLQQLKNTTNINQSLPLSRTCRVRLKQKPYLNSISSKKKKSLNWNLIKISPIQNRTWRLKYVMLNSVLIIFFFYLIPRIHRPVKFRCH